MPQQVSNPYRAFHASLGRLPAGQAKEARCGWPLQAAKHRWWDFTEELSRYREHFDSYLLECSLTHKADCCPTKQTVAHIQLYDCYQNSLPFLSDYNQSFHKKAFADPYIEYKWYTAKAKRDNLQTNHVLRSLGKDLTAEQYEQTVTERNTLRDWIRTTILPPASDGQSLDKTLIFPSGDTEPMYRHEYHK